MTILGLSKDDIGVLTFAFDLTLEFSSA